MRLKGKKVLVVGLGRSGLAAIRFFLKQGAQVAVADRKKAKELEAVLQEFPQLSERYFGGHLPEAFENRDLVCLSPGVRSDLPGLERARRRQVPIVGEMGLAAEYLTCPLIAVTGTNGKSTTSTLIAELLKAGGEEVALAGNIGRPLLEVVMENRSYDRVVIEVSSFQLETVRRFRPQVAVLLNATPDHLDRYQSFRDYVRTKMRILKNQTSRDFVVYNQEDPQFVPYLRHAVAKKIPFSIRRLLNDGLFVSGGRILRRWKGEFEEYPLSPVKLVGLHNVENIMAAIGAARSVGVSPEVIRKRLETFEGLPHRMQLVHELGGVRFYDDSKGTNVDAVIKSIAGFKEKQVLLIAGGRGKGTGFTSLREVVAQKVRLLLLIGESGPKIARELSGTTEIRETGTLGEAVKVAAREARSGDCVVLSPACASFDQFRNFEDRGNQFQELVKQL